MAPICSSTSRSGNFFNGTLFTEDGTKLKDVVPTTTTTKTSKTGASSENDAEARVDQDAETND